ncbi:hypothetical protein H257_10374 [Aphanomyces astaci]|uniref:Uncharacterized protein n=1 Tax=Aphanomyces astaci TaxID=112090 RepID=W4G667_APHAT|nr:hypothetical protein H257_10374 [Aphanomyces astaci]ETV75155.1 hypothetical protein H257_10374 [Aphanomyces astaci]|eukprot:XP_009835203.1 hypothetical protein H257_10374 [Aphanomyces astaci]
MQHRDEGLGATSMLLPRAEKLSQDTDLQNISAVHSSCAAALPAYATAAESALLFVRGTK